MGSLMGGGSKKDDDKKEKKGTMLGQSPGPVLPPAPAATAAPAAAPAAPPPVPPTVDRKKEEVASLIVELNAALSDAKSFMEVDLAPGETANTFANQRLTDLRAFAVNPLLTHEQQMEAASVATTLQAKMDDDAAKAEAAAKAKEEAEKAKLGTSQTVHAPSMPPPATVTIAVVLAGFGVKPTGKALKASLEHLDDDRLEELRKQLEAVQNLTSDDQKQKHLVFGSIDRIKKDREARNRQTMTGPQQQPQQQPAAPPVQPQQAPPQPPQMPPQMPPPARPGQATQLQRVISSPWYKRPGVWIAIAMVVLLVWFAPRLFEDSAADTVTTTTSPTPSPTTVPEHSSTVTATAFACVPASERDGCGAIPLETSPLIGSEHLAGRLASAPHWDCTGVFAPDFSSRIHERTFDGCSVCRWCEPASD